jgi:hypothetical protein
MHSAVIAKQRKSSRFCDSLRNLTDYTRVSSEAHNRWFLDTRRTTLLMICSAPSCYMPLGQTNLPQGRIGLISHEILPPAAILDTSVTSVTSITWTHVPNIKSLSFQSQRPFLQKTYRMFTPGNVPSVDQATCEAKMQEKC